ncbi:MAG: MerR family transcriptional regulator [Anaerolineae bacterium]|nr:MerR family transcriptional regulator [Anaerolineae bacterium]
MNDNEEMTISELADAAGVTVRTIRYYVNEGLLPPAETSGRYALYDASYLDRLELIRRWKDAYLPLKEIRERMAQLTDAQVREMLQQLDAVEAAPPALDMVENHSLPIAASPKSLRETSALDYIHTLRGGKPAETPPDQEALDYIHDIRKRQSVTPPPRKRSWGNPPGEPWRRIQVFPGFEIHIAEAIYQQFEQEFQRLLDWISQNFTKIRHS